MVAKTGQERQERLDLLRRIHDASLNLWVGEQDRLLALTASMLELTGSGKRNSDDICIVLQAIHDGKKFRSVLGEIAPAAPDLDADLRGQLSSWQSRYLGMGIKKDFFHLRIPQRPNGLSRPIVVVRDLKVSRIITHLQNVKRVRFWTYADLESLDKVKDIVQRPEGDYVIWVRDRQEADEELNNKSANDIEKEGINTETLKERLLHEYAYLEETDKHLDVKNATLCSGSRRPDGSVPDGVWDPGDGRVCVNAYHPADAHGPLRSREVVS